MAEQILTLMADFDEESQQTMGEWYEKLEQEGFIGKQTKGLPFHISLGTFALDKEQAVIQEMKMINETKKIMEMPELSVAATCVRVPVVSGHSESVYIELEKDATVQDIFDVLKDAPGIVLQDDITTQTYPMPIYAEGEDPTFVGRIRQDLDNKKGFHMWIVADNLLKGAALNSIQIAEAMLEDNLL